MLHLQLPVLDHRILMICRSADLSEMKITMQSLNFLTDHYSLPVGVFVHRPGHLRVGRRRRGLVQLGEVIGHALERHLGRTA